MGGYHAKGETERGHHAERVIEEKMSRGEDKKGREKEKGKQKENRTHSCKPRFKIPYTVPPHNIKFRMIAECTLHNTQTAIPEL